MTPSPLPYLVACACLAASSYCYSTEYQFASLVEINGTLINRAGTLDIIAPSVPQYGIESLVKSHTSSYKISAVGAADLKIRATATQPVLVPLGRLVIQMGYNQQGACTYYQLARVQSVSITHLNTEYTLVSPKRIHDCGSGPYPSVPAVSQALVAVKYPLTISSNTSAPTIDVTYELLPGSTMTSYSIMTGSDSNNNYPATFRAVLRYRITSIPFDVRVSPSSIHLGTVAPDGITDRDIVLTVQPTGVPDNQPRPVHIIVSHTGDGTVNVYDGTKEIKDDTVQIQNTKTLKLRIHHGPDIGAKKHNVRLTISVP